VRLAANYKWLTRTRTHACTHIHTHILSLPLIQSHSVLSLNRSKWAMRETQGRGVDAAVDFLFSHADDAVPTASASAAAAVGSVTSSRLCQPLHALPCLCYQRFTLYSFVPFLSFPFPSCSLLSFPYLPSFSFLTRRSRLLIRSTRRLRSTKCLHSSHTSATRRKVDTTVR
jgi:hypothetical protein